MFPQIPKEKKKRLKAFENYTSSFKSITYKADNL